jgi:hypothetical protein
MQHPDETLANIRLENEMKHLKHTLETYMYSHCNMCNISIYLCNIKMKYLKHLKHSYNMGFAWTNGATPVQRATTANGPRCVIAARATRRRAWCHTNLVSLACLLEHPS